jgi:SEC-C motif-containing protein
MGKSASKSCPCHSALSYATCCAPLHRRTCVAPTATALMRSRYAAFALGFGDYLADTLNDDHPDRTVPREELVRALSRVKERQRFLGLRILDSDERRVLFHARIFERGRDMSFVELSEFVRTFAGEFRYSGGRLLPCCVFPRSEFEHALEIAAFLELYATVVDSCNELQ